MPANPRPPLGAQIYWMCGEANTRLKVSTDFNSIALNVVPAPPAASEPTNHCTIILEQSYAIFYSCERGAATQQCCERGTNDVLFPALSTELRAQKRGKARSGEILCHPKSICQLAMDSRRRGSRAWLAKRKAGIERSQATAAAAAAAMAANCSLARAALATVSSIVRRKCSSSGASDNRRT